MTHVTHTAGPYEQPAAATAEKYLFRYGLRRSLELWLGWLCRNLRELWSKWL